MAVISVPGWFEVRQHPLFCQTYPPIFLSGFLKVWDAKFCRALCPWRRSVSELAVPEPILPSARPNVFVVVKVLELHLQFREIFPRKLKREKIVVYFDWRLGAAHFKLHGWHSKNIKSWMILKMLDFGWWVSVHKSKFKGITCALQMPLNMGTVSHWILDAWIQWWPNYWKSLVFEWSKCVWSLNGKI